MTQPSDDLRREFGDIDIYLFDQLHRGRIRDGMSILDAGCGGGRNLVYLMRRGFDVFGTDANHAAIGAVRQLASRLAPALPAGNFRTEPVERMSFSDATFDVVISSAVMHFARDEPHWRAMLDEMVRVLRPGGLFFARLATTIGHESRVKHVSGRRYIMPDGDERFLVDENFIMLATRTANCELLDPLKTSVVQNTRSMMTWVMRKAVSA
jgi:SAM-dependent methyltransferase